MAAEDAQTVFRQPKQQPKQQALFVSALFRETAPETKRSEAPANPAVSPETAPETVAPSCFGCFGCLSLRETQPKQGPKQRSPKGCPDKPHFSSKSNSFVGNGEKQDG